MLKFSKLLIVCSVILLLPELTSAQNCDLSISGFVKDVDSGIPVSFANILEVDSRSGVLTDSLGYFRFTSMCAGKHTFSLSYIGCVTQEFVLNVSNDTTITLFLECSSQLLNEAEIIAPGGLATTQENSLLTESAIAQSSNRDLATMLESISGVSTIKNGSGISKPVVHGLYGNRLAILNNGIAQSGQQWGADHSPEIDPLVANTITVIKGVGALEYPGSSLGSVILVEPKKIDKESRLHGESRYFFESNGLGNGLNLELQQHTKALAWRAIGTLKKSGDKHTSKYFLTNTGRQEANIALQLEKSWNSKWSSDLYLSSFNAQLGVLRGSQIGNLTDLEEALERSIPFFTEENFSYSIKSPYQQVNHHLLKFHTKYSLSEKQSLDLTYSAQYNLRKEFDVRRSGRSETPALSLEQVSNLIELKYLNYLPKNWKLKTGIQVNGVDNSNLPETGILPLIPDYIAREYGVFGLLSKRFNKTTIEFGGRYDIEIRKVAAISIEVPREIIRYENQYDNPSAMLGLTRRLGKSWQASYNIGYAVRNPEVNELYSNGLHQGVSGIEEGDPTLNAERSIKNTLSLRGEVKERFSFEGLLYLQRIENYIFLVPQDEVRLTIRGAFPVFKYEQAAAQLTGLDLSATYSATQQLHITGKYSYLHGYDNSNDMPLVFMPSNNFSTQIKYQIPKFKKLENLEFQVNTRFVFEQRNLLPSQDFVDPPSSYHLVNLKMSAERQLARLRLNVFVRAENVLNETYRDYLNRQRYFADDLGFNCIVGVNISFL